MTNTQWLIHNDNNSIVTRSNRMGAKIPENPDRVHPSRRLNSQQGDHAPMVQKRSDRPRRVSPVSRSRCHDAQDYRKSPSLINNNLTNRRINNNNNIILLANFHVLLIRVFSVISINTYFNINYFYKRPLFFHLDFN